MQSSHSATIPRVLTLEKTLLALAPALKENIFAPDLLMDWLEMMNGNFHYYIKKKKKLNIPQVRKTPLLFAKSIYNFELTFEKLL